MKKLIIILFACVSFSSTLLAQDTVCYPDPWYMYHSRSKLIYPRSVELNPAWVYGCCLNTTIMPYKWTPGDTIFGVAVTVSPLIIANNTEIVTDYSIFTAIREDSTIRAVLYEGSWLPSLGPVSLVDTARPDSLHNCYFYYDWDPDTDRVQPCVEFYFDYPHTSFSSDTFYVGFHSHQNNNSSSKYQYFYRPRLGVMRETVDLNVNPYDWIFFTGYLDNPSPTYDTFSFFGPGFYMENGKFMRHWGCIFPIVKLRCKNPPVLHIGERVDPRTMTVSWQANAETGLYQLSLGTYGSNPDTGMIVMPTDTFYTFTDLLPDTIYQVWARKACRYTTAGYDTLVWSDWSRPVIFRASVGIGEVDDMTLQVTTRDGGIAVQGLAAGERAEVFDMQGRRVASLASDGVTPPLPQGVYLLRTTAHSRTRKVVLLR